MMGAKLFLCYDSADAMRIERLAFILSAQKVDFITCEMPSVNAHVR